MWTTCGWRTLRRCMSFAEEPLYILDHNIRVEFAPERPTAANPPDQQALFYDFRGNEETLRTVLAEVEGSIMKAHFLCSSVTDELTGSGFIEFQSVERATQALEAVGGTMTPFGTLNLEYVINKPQMSCLAGTQPLGFGAPAPGWRAPGDQQGGGGDFGPPRNGGGSSLASKPGGLEVKRQFPEPMAEFES
ncbi:hypothetical protein B0H16DRAFT_1806066 [Mycena metata]|uniref:RRM domain-containing protein n=1 Tax=Mycena metata TaxID=1033252 RepID=A0AAD7MG20_9AGAR|nr:hypothetical protein B0H16DRAFT_1806066 [Mycena metata]